MTDKTKRPDDDRDQTAKDATKSTGAAKDAPAPLSFTLEPASGPEHTPIMITGDGDFGDQPGTLALNEVPAPNVLWSPIAISTIVPYGAKTGELVVTTADGRRGSAPFTVTEKRDA